MDSAEHTPIAGSAERGRGDRGGNGLKAAGHALEVVDPEDSPSAIAAAPRSDAHQPSATRLEPASAAVPSAAKHQKDDNNDEKRGGIHTRLL